MGILVSVVLISTLLIFVNATMLFAFTLIRGDVPAYGPVRRILHYRIARRETQHLDQAYASLLGW